VRRRDTLGSAGLFVLLSAFTLSTLDGGEIATHIVSAILFLVAAAYFSFPFGQRLTLSLPAVCLLLMTCYGIVQTLWFPQKIVYYGWTGVLFWFTAAMIALLATQLFRDPRIAARFRLAFVVFATAVCVLDLLEQASHTSKYFWLIQSRYHAVFGSFSYWNNFAEFVELALPITLWQGLARSKPSIPYLLMAALQIGAVVASGSRAGTALVCTELLAILTMTYFRVRNKSFVFGAVAAVALSLIFIYAAGMDSVVAKLQRNDQLAVRRDINYSSLAMIREHPFTGWGLNTYVPVYPMFARYDDGTFVNRAHNDWLQWAVEGGIFFAGLMLVVFLWSIRPAYRSGWGIGVIAICLHAIVDYPFARLGVCAWYFALVAMLASAGPVPESIRVASWNIDHGSGLDTITSALKSNPADLYLFQEVDQNALRSGQKDVAAELGKRLGMHVAYAAEFEELGQERGGKAFIGQATLTSLPILKSRVIHFQKQSGFWQPHAWLPSSLPLMQRRLGGRVALVTELEFVGHRMVVYNAHLESRSAGPIQVAQLDEMLADLKQYPAGTPAILGGDLNTKYFPSIYLHKLERLGFHSATGEKIERTHTIAMALDWLFARGSIKLDSGQVRRDIKGSDHYPVYARLTAE
jgi:endonuclease/exonuclease/phosphatase family metal-dependent hydrolase/O-antigen ligase